MNAVSNDKRTDSVDRRSWRIAVLSLLLLAGLGIVAGPPTFWLSAAPEEPSPLPSQDELLVDVRVEGHTTIPTDHIAKYIKTRAGKPASPKQIQDDVRSLFGTNLFFSVEPRFRRTKRGLVLIFRVIERPVVTHVEYRGNKKIKTKHLAELTGIKPGSPFDISANRESVRRIQQSYREKGHIFAKVHLASGGKKEDRKVIFVIDEGPKVRVGSVKFAGNEFFSSSVLGTKLRTKKAILWMFGGLYDPATIPDDIAALKQYYHGLGFFDVNITHKVGFNKSRSRAHLLYTIKEGARYKVRRVEIVGNKILTQANLRKNLKLVEGEYFTARLLSRDVSSVKGKYDKLGRIFASIDAVPRFLEEPGVADLVYQIDEDYVYRIRRVNVIFRDENPHTQRSVVRSRMLIHPGDLANRRLIERSKTRLGGIQIFASGRQNPQKAPAINARRVQPTQLASREEKVRGQNADPEYGRGSPSPTPFQPRLQPRYQPRRTSPANGGVNRFRPADSEAARRYSSNPFDLSQLNRDGTLRRSHVRTPLPNRFPADYRARRESPSSFSLPFTDRVPDAFYFRKPARQSRRRGTTIRGQNVENGIDQPGSPLFDSPSNDPLGSAVREGDRFRELDLDVLLSETRTGRFMFGVGVNSNAGVVGSIVLSESNFDIMRPPKSVDDLFNGEAWRGGGQRLRLEAVPGNIVSRYLVSWTDPYFLKTDYSLSVSGFFYNRFLQDWDEQRTGGRIAVGKQITPTFSVAGSLRLEEVVIDNPDTPTPRILADSVGSSLLSTLGVTLTHDTRDSPFLSGEGHLVKLGYEQAVGNFVYPRFTATASQFFTLYRRADGFGRHIVTLRGQLGWTDIDTPIFERFFAGGFQTFRGFAWRGVGPRILGVRTGGRWMALGTVEYMLPLMANETIQGVAFTDFGTVENKVGFDQFRMTAGIGLRVTIPAMGPVPLAFDFAFPVLKEKFDDEQFFSFYVGFTR